MTVNDSTNPPPGGTPVPPEAATEPATSFKWVIVAGVSVWVLGAAMIVWSRYLSN